MQPTDTKLRLSSVQEAKSRLQEVISASPLQHNINYSDRHEAHISFKREDLQNVRSYKIRGAYNKINHLLPEELQAGVVCASAGNHAQGVAYSCRKLGVKGTIFMPAPTPRQKIDQVSRFGKEYVEVVIGGDTFDDASEAALRYAESRNKAFIHPFDDKYIIEGQATIGLELLEQHKEPIDYIFLPIGGGGLAAGICSVFKQLSPKTKLIGVEPLGAAAMKHSLELGYNSSLDKIEKFVDGAAVRQVGHLNFSICKELLDQATTVAEGAVCSEILKLYNQEAIVAEPAGALSIAALNKFTDEIRGKNVVCIVSGGNNDITRMEEIKERSLLYENLKHYFIVKFPQRAGALREFVVNVLGANDDITHFEYTKKTSREKGAAIVGIELKNQKDFEPLCERMKEQNFWGEYLNNKPNLFQYLV